MLATPRPGLVNATLAVVVVTVALGRFGPAAWKTAEGLARPAPDLGAEARRAAELDPLVEAMQERLYAYEASLGHPVP